MNWQEFKLKLAPWKPVVYLEQIVSHSTRKIFKKFFLIFALINVVLASGILIPKNTPEVWANPLLFCLFMFMTIGIAEVFFYSNYFRDINSEDFGVELSLIIKNTKKVDVTNGFVFSMYGKMILLRLGLDRRTVIDFLNHRKVVLTADKVVFPQSKTLLESYLSGIVFSDHEFETFLLSHGISREILIMCAKWYLMSIKRGLDKERWWSEASLSLVQGIGQDWAYGKTYFLSRFSRPLRINTQVGTTYHLEEALALETILSKDRESNALIVGEEGVGKIEIVELLATKIEHRHTTPALKNKKFIVFGTAMFIAAMPDKESFEQALIKVFNEASAAGNIILIIPEFASLIHNGSVLGSDVASLIDPYLNSEELQIIAVCNNQDYHSRIENNQMFMKRFDTVLVKGGSELQIRTILENSIPALESREKVFFTYQAILAAVSGANRYFVDKSLLDTSSDLLSQAIANAHTHDREIIWKEDVLDLIQSKTGVPIGEVSNLEQEKLINLEKYLHERVIDQNEAINSISSALRRARAGITNPSRPMGSFLFLGPTGVGKTETTKALAEVFFGAENKILRLDMSEYNTEDALNRLIGSEGDQNGGILGAMIREHQYGVLLLDEFEKTDRRVLDLFLQILDEGMFSDALGRKVSARNLIIVATSNAGGEMIFEIVERGENLDEKKDSIIEEIIKQGIYKPELINRFDGVILFHPLREEHLKEVAKLMLKKLALRLKDQGITLNTNDSLIDVLVSSGNDPRFGARALNRIMQDKVEKVIADKIISGKVAPGSELTLTEEDIK